jgi:hypothetical protein
MGIGDWGLGLNSNLKIEIIKLKKDYLVYFNICLSFIEQK